MTTQAVTVKLVLNADDFEYLTVNSVTLDNPADMPNWADRFHDPARGEFLAPLELEQWRHAYWLDGYTALILARSFLTAWGEPFLAASDEYEPGGWVIFTNYDAHVRAVAATDPECE